MGTSHPGRSTAIISYITIVGALIAMTMNMEPKNPFARFHIRQAFGIHLLYHSLSIFLNFSKIDSGWIFVWGFYLLAWVYGLWHAIAYKEQLLPFLGKYFQKWFTFIP